MNAREDLGYVELHGVDFARIVLGFVVFRGQGLDGFRIGRPFFARDLVQLLLCDQCLLEQKPGTDDLGKGVKDAIPT